MKAAALSTKDHKVQYYMQLKEMMVSLCIQSNGHKQRSRGAGTWITNHHTSFMRASCFIATSRPFPKHMDTINVANKS